METYKVVMSPPGIYLPSTVMTNADLEKIVDTSDEWITSMTGMKERRISLDKPAKEMAVEAMKDLLEKTGINKDEIGAIKLSLNRHDDDVTFPQHAGYVAKAIGRSGKIDFRDGPFMGCVGLIGVIEEAYNALMNPKKDINLIAAGATENLTGFTNYADRNTCILFGDAAVFYFLKRVPANSDEEGIINFFTQGTYDSEGFLTMEKSKGLRIRPPKSNDSGEKWSFEEIEQNWLTMVGEKVMGFASRAMKRATHRVLEGTQYTLENLDFIVPHSANKRIIDPAINYLMSKKGAKFKGKVITCYEEYGNTSSTSLGLAEAKGRDKGDIKPGDLGLFVAFGGGLQEGAYLARMS